MLKEAENTNFTVFILILSRLKPTIYKSLRFDRACIVVVGDIEIYKKYLNSIFHD
jgi:hypothetical protein